MEISIKTLFTVFKKALVLMVVLAVVLGAVAFVFSSRFVQKVYTSSSTYFLAFPLSFVDDSSFPDANDMADFNNSMVVGSRMLPNIMQVLLNKESMRHVLDYVHEMATVDPEYVLDHEYTGALVSGMMSYKISDQTEYSLVFNITCSAYSARDSRIILDALSVQQDEVLRSMGLQRFFSFTRVVSPVDGVLTSPNVLRNTVLWAFLAAVVVYVAYFVAHLLYGRIYTESDLKAAFDLPVLAQVPCIKEADRHDI